MKKDWISIDVTVKGALVDITTALLASYGCSGTVIEDQQLDSFEVPDQELDPAVDYCLTTYFETDRPMKALVADLKEMLQSVPALSGDQVVIKANPALTAVDWAQNWKQNFSSFKVGDRLLVRPSWEDVEPVGTEVVIEIDPGMAFGTGTHATTRLCLEVISELLPEECRSLRVLDVGTGSGILAIGAAALGCSAVVATDIDPVACGIARENVAKNDFSDQVLVTDTPLESLTGFFDLVVANILAEENIRLKTALAERLVPGGWLILSGILSEKAELVGHAFSGADFTQKLVRYQDDWVCLAFQRH